MRVPKAGLVGRPLTRFICGEDQDRYFRHKKELVETGERQVVQLRMAPHGAESIWVRVEETMLSGSNGTRLHRVVVSDVTAQKHAEQVLAASESHHRLLFQRSRDGLMTVVPPLGRFTSGNIAALAMFGAGDEHQFTTLGLVECSPVHQPDGSLSSERAAEMIEAALRDGSTYAEWTFMRLSGEEFLASVLLTRIEINGEPVLQATVRDETQTKKLQASISQQDRLASMGLLAAGVAHEINNPLATVVFNLETLTEELPRLAGTVDAPALNDLVERAREALVGAQRIKIISRAIGTFARVEDTERSRVDVNHAVQCAATMALNDIRFRARLVLDLGDLPSVWASEGKLSQVFLNLLINAAQAVGDGAIEKNRIRIRTWTEGDKAPASPTVSDPLPSGRILVIDDEPTIRSLIARMLAKKHEVVTAESAEAARAILEKDDGFDAVLCDLMMPGMTGMDLHQWLLANDPELAGRVIFLTGGAFTPKAAEYIQKVTNRTLEKPFAAAKLDEALSAVMSGVGGSGPVRPAAAR